MSRLYFAHPMSDYDTQWERRVLGYLAAVEPFSRYEVENPNQPKHQHAYDTLKRFGRLSDDASFKYWTRLAASCEALVFVRMPSGAIGAGVAKEVERAFDCGMRVYEVALTAGGALQHQEWEPLSNEEVREGRLGMSVDDTRTELAKCYAAPNGGRPW